MTDFHLHQICICLLLIGVCMFFPLFTEDIFFVLVGDDFVIAFWILMAVTLITGATTATLQPPIVGFCNYLPIEYIQISVAGQAIAGIFASVIRILVNLLPVDIDTNALIYFGICGAMLLIIGFAFLYIVRSAFVKFHFKRLFLDKKISQKTSNRVKRIYYKEPIQTILRKIVDDSVPTPRLLISNNSTKLRHKVDK